MEAMPDGQETRTGKRRTEATAVFRHVDAPPSHLSSLLDAFDT